MYFVVISMYVYIYTYIVNIITLLDTTDYITLNFDTTKYGSFLVF